MKLNQIEKAFKKVRKGKWNYEQFHNWYSALILEHYDDGVIDFDNQLDEAYDNGYNDGMRDCRVDFEQKALTEKHRKSEKSKKS